MFLAWQLPVLVSWQVERQPCLMALYRYFKPVPKKLPDPDGPLSESIPSASIQDANEAYLKAAARSEMSKRKSYIGLQEYNKHKLLNLLLLMEIRRRSVTSQNSIACQKSLKVQSARGSPSILKR